MTRKTVFISADHGLAIVYFLQSGLIAQLLKDGVTVVLFTDDHVIDTLQRKYSDPNLYFESLRLEQCTKYFKENSHRTQFWLHFLRWVGGAKRINTNAIDSHLKQMQFEASANEKKWFFLIKFFIFLLRRSRIARNGLYRLQRKFTPDFYDDLFTKYKPDMVIASTPGWRLDRYLLRSAKKNHVSTCAVIVGWDNPSSYCLVGADVDFITCWSEIQKKELMDAADWKPEKINIGGIPSYDGYFRNEWIMPKEEYFSLHGLDPKKSLISYACSFVTFAPNFPNIEVLSDIVSSKSLSKPCQLLIRLHPNHFIKGSLFEQEANRIRQYIKGKPAIHLVEPVSLGGSLGHYSGEDMVEKSSMMRHSDVFVTVYSTMVVETAIHKRPVVSLCIDAPNGWNQPAKFSLKLQEIGEWPTHQRFRESGAGIVAMNKNELSDAINSYLDNPDLHRQERKDFIEREVTFTDGKAAIRTKDYFMEVLGKQ